MKPPGLERRIRADLEAKIQSGAWPPGQRIPTELELMAAYGCSRMTVSKAIGTLAHSGLVERRKRAGSFVTRPHVQTAVLEIPDIPALIASRGESYRFERLTRRRRALDPAFDPASAVPVFMDIVRHMLRARPAPAAGNPRDNEETSR